MVSRSKCDVTVAYFPLKHQTVRQNGVSVLHMIGFDKGGVEKTTCMVSFLLVLNTVKLQVPGCLAVAHRAGCLCKHFLYQHLLLQVALVQEGKDLLPCCDLCNMNVL